MKIIWLLWLFHTSLVSCQLLLLILWEFYTLYCYHICPLPQLTQVYLPTQLYDFFFNTIASFCALYLLWVYRHPLECSPPSRSHICKESRRCLQQIMAASSSSARGGGHAISFPHAEILWGLNLCMLNSHCGFMCANTLLCLESTDSLQSSTRPGRRLPRQLAKHGLALLFLLHRQAWLSCVTKQTNTKAGEMT